MKGGFGGRFAPTSFGAAVWVIASTELISAIMGGGLRVQVGASRPGSLRRNRGPCRSTRRYRTQRFVVAPGQLQERCHAPAQLRSVGGSRGKANNGGGNRKIF